MAAEHLKAFLSAQNNISADLKKISSGFEKVAATATVSAAAMDVVEDRSDSLERSLSSLDEELGDVSRGMASTAITSEALDQVSESLRKDIAIASGAVVGYSEALEEMNSDAFAAVVGQEALSNSIDDVGDEATEKSVEVGVSRVVESMPDFTPDQRGVSQSYDFDFDFREIRRMVDKIKAQIASLPDLKVVRVVTEFDSNNLRQRFSELAGSLSSKANLHRREIVESISRSKFVETTEKVRRVTTDVDLSSLSRLSARLSELRDRTLNVDVDTHTSALTALQGRLATLRDRTVNVDVDTDALGELAVSKAVNLFSGRKSRESLIDMTPDVGGLFSFFRMFGDRGPVGRIASSSLKKMFGDSALSGLTGKFSDIGVSSGPSTVASIGAKVGILGSAIGAIVSLIGVIGGLATASLGLAGVLAGGLIANVDKETLKSFKNALKSALEPFRNPQFKEISLGLLQAAVNLVHELAEVGADLGPTVGTFLSSVAGTWNSVKPEVFAEFKDLMRELSPIVADMISGGLHALPGLFNWLTETTADLYPMLDSLVSRMGPMFSAFGFLGNMFLSVLLPLLEGFIGAIAYLETPLRLAWEALKPLLQSKEFQGLMKMIGSMIGAFLALSAAIVIAVTTIGGLAVLAPFLLIAKGVGIAMNYLSMLYYKSISVFKDILGGVISAMNMAIMAVNEIIPGEKYDLDTIENPFGDGLQGQKKKKKSDLMGGPGRKKGQNTVNNNIQVHGDLNSESLESKVNNAVHAALRDEVRKGTPLND